MMIKILKRFVKKIYHSVQILPISPLLALKSYFTWRRKALLLLNSQKGLQLHLGCGDRHYKDMLNCEYRKTKAADVIMDCSNLSRFNTGSVSLIFANAFFEHLYRNQQLPLLRDCYRVLKKGAPLVLLGIPDFKVIAEAYVNKTPLGSLHKLFDVNEAYRYTHGDPETVNPESWLEQLHKSLFDEGSLSRLLKRAGFQNFETFEYRYPNERIPVNLGVIAWKETQSKQNREVLKDFEDYFDNINEIHFLQII